MAPAQPATPDRTHRFCAAPRADLSSGRAPDRATRQREPRLADGSGWQRRPETVNRSRPARLDSYLASSAAAIRAVTLDGLAGSVKYAPSA